MDYANNLVKFEGDSWKNLCRRWGTGRTIFCSAYKSLL